MDKNQLNWDALLRRVNENATLLSQLEDITESHRVSFTGFCAVLLESGFTIPETQELYRVLHAREA